MGPSPDPRMSCIQPSSQQALTREQVQKLPVGAIVLRRYKEGPWRVYWIAEPATEHRSPRAHVWTYGPGWGEWSKVTEPLGAEVEIRLPKLPRISVRMTEEAVRARRKTVTRRLHTPTWCKPGVLALVVDRVRSAGAIGLAVVEITSVRVERLDAITTEDIQKEGVNVTTPAEFVDLFCEGHGWRLGPPPWSKLAPPVDLPVSRIEWRYL